MEFDTMIENHGRWIQLWPSGNDKKWGYVIGSTDLGVFVRFSRIVIDSSFGGCSERVNDVYFYPFHKIVFRFVSKEEATEYTVKKAYKRQIYSHDDPVNGFTEII